MYRIAYCNQDGDDQFLDTLEQTLDGIGRACLVSHIPGLHGLLSALTRQAYDLIFLDMGDGVKTAEQLRRDFPCLPVVLLSGGSVPAEDVPFLYKPVSRERLRELLLPVLHPSLPLRPSGAVRTVPPVRIVYIEVFDHLLRIHTSDRMLLSAAGPLDRMQRELPEGEFLRCHKSYLVNLAYVEGIRRYQILLAGGQCVPTSKKNYNQIRQTVLRRFLDPAGGAQEGGSSG